MFILYDTAPPIFLDERLESVFPRLVLYRSNPPAFLVGALLVAEDWAITPGLRPEVDP
jgi:hypothetical protein